MASPINISLGAVISYIVLPVDWISKKLSRAWVLKVKWAIRHTPTADLEASELNARLNFMINPQEEWIPGSDYLKGWFYYPDVVVYNLSRRRYSEQLRRLLLTELSRRDRKKALEMIAETKLCQLLRMFGPTNYWG